MKDGCRVAPQMMQMEMDQTTSALMGKCEAEDVIDLEAKFAAISGEGDDKDDGEVEEVKQANAAPVESQLLLSPSGKPTFEDVIKHQHNTGFWAGN